MPLIRRVPKRGFWNRSRIEYQVVNVRDLSKLEGNDVTPASLLESSLIAKADQPVKILGFGEVDRAVAIKGCAMSKKAREKIEAAGGRIEA
jgi:large subunit ribosomal protein L15